MKLNQFLEVLGSKKGAPGGGAAAALTGATGAALVEMTARLNDAREKKSNGSASKAAALRRVFQKLIDQDAKAFLGIQKIYKIRKEKPATWQSALKKGAAVPMQICENCVKASFLAHAEKNRTSRWLESDRKEALILLQAAFDSAELNVEVNLNEITDSAFCVNTRKKISQWKQQTQKS